MATSKSSEAARAVLQQHGFTADSVLDGALALLQIDKDADLARALRVSRSVVATWRRRNKIPFEELLALHLTSNFDFVGAIFRMDATEYAADRIDREGDERERSEAELLRDYRAWTKRLETILGRSLVERSRTTR